MTTPPNTAGSQPIVIFDPRLAWGGARIGPAATDPLQVAARIYRGESVEAVGADWGLTRPQILVACWWATEHGPREDYELVTCPFSRFWAAWSERSWPALAEGEFDAVQPPPSVTPNSSRKSPTKGSPEHSGTPVGPSLPPAARRSIAGPPPGGVTRNYALEGSNANGDDFPLSTCENVLREPDPPIVIGIEADGESTGFVVRIGQATRIPTVIEREGAGLPAYLASVLAGLRGLRAIFPGALVAIGSASPGSSQAVVGAVLAIVADAVVVDSPRRPPGGAYPVELTDAEISPSHWQPILTAAWDVAGAAPSIETARASGGIS